MLSRWGRTPDPAGGAYSAPDTAAGGEDVGPKNPPPTDCCHQRQRIFSWQLCSSHHNYPILLLALLRASAVKLQVLCERYPTHMLVSKSKQLYHSTHLVTGL